MRDTELFEFNDPSDQAPPLEPELRASRGRRLRPTGSADCDASLSRLAAILVADVVDYTRHMAEDEAGTHASFTAIWQAMIAPNITRHAARIVKNTGDGFLAEFWSATGAVRCAVDFQDAIHAWNARRRKGRRLVFRVGINVGDVIAEPHDIFGHNVNVAARLEALAEPGGILVSYAVFASVRDRAFRFEDVGELSLKNLAHPVRGFRVTGRTARRPSHRPMSRNASPT